MTRVLRRCEIFDIVALAVCFGQMMTRLKEMETTHLQRQANNPFSFLVNVSEGCQ